eukprot:CAMPEP_0174915158 /NCGR_PEP_ID=MMETSP1355-20121228/572_1 /TAXON_ID=464990 /ORGANISM="Hemiselmis tepida, Strain CCMP443" /LENGTH=128 /DNA_ID=CAMNT_0016159997 /DNA_START=48 /DNA_END=435 /DNA_ORIENTATION=+
MEVNQDALPSHQHIATAEDQEVWAARAARIIQGQSQAHLAARRGPKPCSSLTWPPAEEACPPCCDGPTEASGTDLANAEPRGDGTEDPSTAAQAEGTTRKSLPPPDTIAQQEDIDDTLKALRIECCLS